MTTFPGFSHTSSPQAFRGLSPANRHAQEIFVELADRLLVTAHTTADACFAPWSRTTFAERAVAAAQTAADLRARPVTVWTVAEQPAAPSQRSCYQRIRTHLHLHA